MFLPSGVRAVPIYRPSLAIELACVSVLNRDMLNGTTIIRLYDVLTSFVKVLNINGSALENNSGRVCLGRSIESSMSAIIQYKAFEHYRLQQLD